MKIAIDGPSGAGKGALAAAISERFGFLNVDTGAMYRGVGLYTLRKGVETTDREKIIPLLDEIDLEMTFDDGVQKIIVNGEDVSGLIRNEKVGKAASDVSAILEVRDFLLHSQRSIAEKYDTVMDGRDIGTFVLPDAEIKIYLTADPEVRAERRRLQLLEKGREQSFEEILEEIQKRDYNDSHREVRPLKMAEDAVLIDNTDMTLEDETAIVSDLIDKARCR